MTGSPREDRPSSWLGDAIALLFLALLVGLLCRNLVPALVDDSFIFLRIARNLGTGAGWTYNTGEVTNASTSVAFTLLLTAVGGVLGYSATSLAASYGLGLYALLAIQYLGWRRRDGWVAALTIALGAGLGGRMIQSFGMAAALLMALVSAAALAYRRNGDHWTTGLLAGAAALTRPEGIAALALIGLVELVRKHRIAWRSVAFASLVVLPWLAFAAIELGSPVPHTVAVKAAQRHLGWWATQPGFAIGFLEQARWPWLTYPLALAGATLAWRRMRAGDAFPGLCIGFGLLQIAGYQLLGAPSGYQWYYVPGNFAVDLCLLLLGWTSLQAAVSRLRKASVRRAATVAGSVALLALMTRIGALPWYLPGSYGLSAQYRMVADWLRANGRADDVVVAAEIGYIGWFSGLRVLDIHGLLHAEALPALRAGNLHWWYDRDEKPRYVVVHVPAWHGEPGSKETWPPQLSADFERRYHKVFRHRRLRVYERDDHRRDEGTSQSPRSSS